MKRSICNDEECRFPVWGGGFCKYHQYMRTDKKVVRNISPFSRKMLKKLSDYRVVRDKFLIDNPICEVCDSKKAIEPHHKKGKIGDLLTNTDYFLAVCRDCHNKIEKSPEWAYEKGYSLNRLSK